MAEAPVGKARRQKSDKVQPSLEEKETEIGMQIANDRSFFTEREWADREVVPVTLTNCQELKLFCVATFACSLWLCCAPCLCAITKRGKCYPCDRT